MGIEKEKEAIVYKSKMLEVTAPRVPLHPPEAAH
jgi:hypothetical protein